MADNVAITAGSGTTIAADDVGSGVLHQRVKVTWGPDGTGNDADVASGKPLPVQLRGSAGGDLVKLEDGASADADPGMPVLAVRKATPANSSGTDGDYEFLQMSSGRIWASATIDAALPAGTNVIGQTYGAMATVTTSVTRPSDTTAYAANDALSSSTSAPAAITFSNVFRTSGGSAIITGLDVIDSANQATLLQGELWLFDTAPTVINDNAAFTISDTEYATVVAKIPFSIDSAGNSAAGASGNAGAFIDGLAIGVTGVGSANLTGLIKILNAYTPVAAEVLTFRLKVLQVN